MSVKEQLVPLAPSSGRVNLVGAATHSVDLDTLDSVRYKMRSFLVGEPLKKASRGGATPQTNAPKAPSPGRVGAAAHYIPAYRLFETKRYDGPLGPLGPLGTPVPKAHSTDQLTVAGGSAPQPKAPSPGRVGSGAHCCICLNNIRKGAMVVSMPLCGHLYHKACLFNWVDLSKNTFCPYCRQDDF
jgi:hypothetical protein